MKRLTFTITDEAMQIYQSWTSHERSKMVSEAIIEYSKKADINNEIKRLKKRISKIEEDLSH